jgi:hypothetical protein
MSTQPIIRDARMQLRSWMSSSLALLAMTVAFVCGLRKEA